MYSDLFEKKAFKMLLQSLGDGSVSSVSSLKLFFFGGRKGGKGGKGRREGREEGIDMKLKLASSTDL